jgi:hypothetical protein
VRNIATLQCILDLIMNGGQRMGMRSVAVMTSSVPAVVWPGNAIRLLKEDHAIEDKRPQQSDLVFQNDWGSKIVWCAISSGFCIESQTEVRGRARRSRYHPEQSLGSCSRQNVPRRHDADLLTYRACCRRQGDWGQRVRKMTY